MTGNTDWGKHRYLMSAKVHRSTQVNPDLIDVMLCCQYTGFLTLTWPTLQSLNDDNACGSKRWEYDMNPASVSGADIPLICPLIGLLLLSLPHSFPLFLLMLLAYSKIYCLLHNHIHTHTHAVTVFSCVFVWCLGLMLLWQHWNKTEIENKTTSLTGDCKTHL